MLNQVEASVHEHDMPIALLGMSFLNRMEMKREGATLTLKKRY
ncbi:MAG: retroviral-like aspartic protease family protein [Azoarcus sp.]|nr:retroviral-like aspartic protease family protein [Azoarcus sp.]